MRNTANVKAISMGDNVEKGVPPAKLLALLAEGKSLWLKISGNSMSPWFRSGSALRVRRCSQACAGDVVVFARGPALVAHIRWDGPRLETRTAGGIADTSFPGEILGVADLGRNFRGETFLIPHRWLLLGLAKLRAFWRDRVSLHQRKHTLRVS